MLIVGLVLLSCGGGREEAPGAVMPDAAPLGAWAPFLELPPAMEPPAVSSSHRWALEGHRSRVFETPVWLDGALRCVDCPPGCDAIPLGPMVLRDGRFVPVSALPAVDQRVELTLDGYQGLLGVRRIVDTPTEGPTPVWWPADWALTVSADGVPVEPVRQGPWAWVPGATQLILDGDGPVPDGHALTVEEVAIYVADLVADRPASTTGVTVAEHPYHLEQNGIQRVPGREALVTGVRFPHSAGRDGVRVLANASEPLSVLDPLLALRDAWGLPRPLWVVPGPRAAFVGGRLVLPPEAFTDPMALRRAALLALPMEATLRTALQGRMGSRPPVEDPGCYGLRSRPSLDRSRVLGLLAEPMEPPLPVEDWAALERLHPELTPWLDAPVWPRLAVRRNGEEARVVDDAATGLWLERVPVRVGGVDRMVSLGAPFPAPADAVVLVDPLSVLPAHGVP